MPTFAPFPGIRYRSKDLSSVIAPPYDVISEDQRLGLEAADPYNAVRLELPQPDDESDRYQSAARRLDAWLGEGGPLMADTDPAFYVYRMSFTDYNGGTRATTGVIGALALEPPGGEILPHERTTPKAKSDRLDLIRATGTNLSPVWGLSLAAGLAELIAPVGSPEYSGVDSEGVSHDVWPIRDPGVLASIAAAVGAAPVVIADGHHRYEVALANQAERKTGRHGSGPWDAVMTYVVELSEHELSVGAIHRLIAGLPDGFDLARALQDWFEPAGGVALDAGISAAMVASGALALVTQAGAASGEATLLRPLARTAGAASHNLDSSRLDVALAAMPGHDLSYQHGVPNVIDAVQAGLAQAGVLLRPATVAQIAEVARTGDRMPPKTTFFTPKPATGLVFRAVR